MINAGSHRAMQERQSFNLLQGWGQPLDRIALVLMLVLSVAIGLLVLGGNHATPRIRDFTWQDRQIGSEDTAFILTFSRPMDHNSVEDNLRLVPPLLGKISWAGRRMAYTLEQPAPYGTAFEVDLRGARDRFSEPDTEATNQPFMGRFRTRDRAFVYLGMAGEEAGRLVLENLTRQEHLILTPPNLVVMNFEPYPLGDRILFAASDRDAAPQGNQSQNLYTVTTGIPVPSSELERRWGIFPEDEPEPEPPGVLTAILDSNGYQNLKFDLSPDGKTIIVRRVNLSDPADFGLWIIRPDSDAEATAQPLEMQEAGGDFLIAPDSLSLAVLQGQGTEILPLPGEDLAEATLEPLDFLPQFGRILNFSKDGTAAAMVKFSPDPPDNPTRKILYLVTNQGDQTELLRTNGDFLSAEFDPMKHTLYLLMTELLPTREAFLEQPFLLAINLDSQEAVTLLQLPMQREIQMDLSPDGLGILLDQVVSDTTGSSEPENNLIQGADGRAIATSRLWFLPIALDDQQKPQPTEPQPLPLNGLRPRWLP